MLQNKTSTHYTYIIYYIGDFLLKSVLFNTNNNKPEVVSTRKEEEKTSGFSQLLMRKQILKSNFKEEHEYKQ